MIKRRARLTIQYCPGNTLLVKLGGMVDRPSGPQECPARGAECLHERRSDARGRGLWSGGAIMGEHGSGSVLFAGPPAQAVALELDTMSVVNEAVQDGVAKSRIGNNVMP